MPEGVAISPVARARVAESGVDVAGITGSGRGGRITAQDVDQAVRPAAEPALAGPYPQSPDQGVYATPMRSEEHTSELQSLMRISYAVFCLQQKKSQTRQVQSCHTHSTRVCTLT